MDMLKSSVSSFLCSSFATSVTTMYNKWCAWGECSWPGLFQFLWLFLVFWVELVTELWSLSMYVPLCLLLWLVSEIWSKHACLSLCLMYCHYVLCIWCFLSSYFPGHFALKVHSTLSSSSSSFDLYMLHTYFLQLTTLGQTIKRWIKDANSKKKSWIFYAKVSLCLYALSSSSWKEKSNDPHSQPNFELYIWFALKF